METSNKSASDSEIWSAVLQNIKLELSEQSFKTWFECVTCSSYSPECVILNVPDVFYGTWLKEHYQEIIRAAFFKVIHSKPEIEYKTSIIPQSIASSPRSILPGILAHKDIIPSKSIHHGGQETQSVFLNDTYTFDNFVVGPGNRFAHAAAVAISESPSKTYNPFFIYGKSGLGKTHLLQSIAHHIKRAFPDKKICYTSSESFTNALINSIHQRTTPQFRAKFRSLDVLLIDDVHFIAGKESTQEEFFHTFNTLYDAKKQIILSSDRSPKEIPSLEARLLSRFEWGLITDIQPPDFETRVAILKKKLERESVTVSNEILFYIAENIKTNIRELEGALIRVCAYASLTESTISLSIVENVLKTSVKEDQKITVDLILQYVAEQYHLKHSDLYSKKRSKNIVLPRQVAMYFIRKYTSHSLPEIGNQFGGRGHATVVYAFNRISQILSKNDPVARDIQEIEKKLI